MQRAVRCYNIVNLFAVGVDLIHVLSRLALLLYPECPTVTVQLYAYISVATARRGLVMA